MGEQQGRRAHRALRVLVVGGTGPTGIPLVRGLVERGHAVTILHRGTHERDETPPVVEHLHADPFDADSFGAAIAGRTWDVVVAMYGRLRRIAPACVGRTGRFVSVGGVPAYRGWMNPWTHEPAGLPVPVREDAPLVEIEADDPKGWRIVRTEHAVFEHHPTATHLRYPMVYGPYQLAPREWCVVRRILDGRRQMVVADDGLTLVHHGYTENLAHALLLAIDRPDAAAGQIFNVGDTEVLTIRQMAELCAAALGADLELVSMPYPVARPAWPLLGQPLPTHRVLDLSLVRERLGYADVVPARDAVGRTARWLAAHQPRGGVEEFALGDPFDYAAEDRLLASWTRLLEALPDPGFHTLPGPGLAYSGPGGRPRPREFAP